MSNNPQHKVASKDAFRTRLLHQEMYMIQRFLDSFESPRDGGKRSAHLAANNRLLILRRFPLPDSFSPDEIDLIIDVEHFPITPPNGIHLILRGNEATIERIRKHLEGHIYASDTGLNASRKIPGGIWVCLHYRGNKWMYNVQNPSLGDNIVKFLEIFYARIL